MRTETRAMRNFIAKYGRNQFRKLIDGLSSGVSGQQLATELGVSRERVRQWKGLFGTSVVVYIPKPEARRFLDERKTSRGQNSAVLSTI